MSEFLSQFADPSGVALLAFVMGAPIWCIACAIHDVIKRRKPNE